MSRNQMNQQREYILKKRSRPVSRQQLVINLAMSVITALFNILAILVVYQVSKYASVSKLKYYCISSITFVRWFGICFNQKTKTSYFNCLLTCFNTVSSFNGICLVSLASY